MSDEYYDCVDGSPLLQKYICPIHGETTAVMRIVVKEAEPVTFCLICLRDFLKANIGTCEELK